MALGGGDDAAQAVLGNPDLVALILEHLPVPRLGFGCYVGGVNDDSKHRWAASQVNSVFRRAALSLPWAAWWNMHGKLDSTSCLRALQAMPERHLQTWTIVLAHQHTVCYGEEENRDCAAVLNHARSTEELTVRAPDERILLEWLLHTAVPTSGEVRGLGVGTPVLACLASSSLTTLYIDCPHWTDALWLAFLPRLRHMTVDGYNGPPLACAPALESLEMRDRSAGLAFEQWLLPSLTALTLSLCDLKFDLPHGSASLQRPGAEVAEATKGCLNRLQHLCLVECEYSRPNTGLKQLVPGLTHLELDWASETSKGARSLLLKGLPAGLKSLSLDGERILGGGRLWSAVCALRNLVVLIVFELDNMCVKKVGKVVRGLALLPVLKNVTLGLYVADGVSQAEVEQGFKPLAALLCSRHGCLSISWWE